MAFSPRLRRFALTWHILSAVGWCGAVGVFVALAALGLLSPDPDTVRGVYLVMEPAARYVLVPLAFLTLVTGVALSLGTVWGLARH